MYINGACLRKEETVCRVNQSIKMSHLTVSLSLLTPPSSVETLINLYVRGDEEHVSCSVLLVSMYMNICCPSHGFYICVATVELESGLPSTYFKQILVSAYLLGSTFRYPLSALRNHAEVCKDQLL